MDLVAHELSDSNGAKGKISNTSIFDCRVCSKPLNLDPIYQCIRGHPTCSRCYRKDMRCYVCNKHVADRSCYVEEMLRSMNMPCKNKGYGCEMVMKYHEKYEHQEACIFEPFSCPIADCEFRGCYNNFASHFNLTHQLLIRQFFFDMPYYTAIDYDEEMVILQELDDGTLFVMNNKVERTKNIISLRHITPSALNMEFSVKLVAISQSGKHPCSIDANVKSLEDSESSKVLSVPYDFFQPSGCLGLEISIKRSGAVSHSGKHPCLIDANVQSIEDAESSTVSSVPNDFSQPSGCFGLEISIKRSGAT